MKLPTGLKIMAILILASFMALSCKSTPPSPELIEDLSAPEMIQRAQERSDVSDWNGAFQWYMAAREKFVDDISITTLCDYEIAFLRYKQGNYNEARTRLEALIAEYNGPNGRFMPPRFYSLAQRVLQTIENR